MNEGTRVGEGDRIGAKKDIGQLSGLIGGREEEEEEQTESTHCDQSVEREGIGFESEENECP